MFFLCLNAYVIRIWRIQFYLGKTSSGYYKAYFIDSVTGIRDYGKSTGTKDKLEAAVIANEL